ncbi:MAG: hypothetical protein CME65_08565 [Halobacteriovoraceae bacterium]|nr:hypothetical protein [Halobacteriovoraceae bacterium]
MFHPSRYLILPPQFYAQNSPMKLENTKLFVFNERLAQELNLDENIPWDRVLAGQDLPHKSLSLVYAGHQFGHFVPQLGDGRAHLLGEIENPQGELFDLQLKGSGRTPYSRQGDGQSPLAPALREFLISEAMAFLDIPTTRSLSVVKTNQRVLRQTDQEGAIVSRLAKAHIRVGSFEYFAAREDKESLKILTEMTRKRLYPEAQDWLEMYELIVSKQASLIAHWMSVGFIHGVMNTDNMSLAGETIDFGPCAFMDEYRANEVFSSIDRYGRYSYMNQPKIAHWNLSVLAGCLAPLASPDQLNHLQDILDSWEQKFNQAYLDIYAPKLGIEDVKNLDKSMIDNWLIYLEEHRLDFTLAHRNLAKLLKQQDLDYFPKTESFELWLKRWRSKLNEEFRPQQIVELEMNTSNPTVIPRNHLVEKALRLAEDGDLNYFNNLWSALKTPYQIDQSAQAEEFSRPPLEHQKIQATFCGT